MPVGTKGMASPTKSLRRAAPAGEPCGARWAICALHRRVALLIAREIQVLEIASGKSNWRSPTSSSSRSIPSKKHVGHILDKPGATNRTQAIARPCRGHGAVAQRGFPTARTFSKPAGETPPRTSTFG